MFAPTTSPFTPSSPTLSPTRAPVAALATTTIYIRLDGVTGPLNENAKAAFQRACLIFLSERVPEAQNNFTCELVSRRLRQQRRRRQQQQQSSSTGTSTVLTATVSSQNYSGDDFSGDVVDAFAVDGDEFVEELQEQSDFYEDVTGVTASDEPLPIVPNSLPLTTTNNTGSLKAGTLAALIVGGLAATMLISAGAYFVSRPRPDEDDAPAPQQRQSKKPLQIEVDQGRGQESETVMFYPPKELTELGGTPAPVASAAAVAAASRLPVYHPSNVSTGGTSRISGLGSAGGISDIEEYSMPEADDINTNRDDDGISGAFSVSSSASSALSSLRQTMVSRTVIAPPGTSTA
jgi:hypothetical protein